MVSYTPRSGPQKGRVHTTIRSMPRSGPCYDQVHGKVRSMARLGTCQCQVHSKVSSMPSSWMPRSYPCQGQVHAKVSSMQRSGPCQGQVHTKVRSSQGQVHAKVRSTPKSRYKPDMMRDKAWLEWNQQLKLKLFIHEKCKNSINWRIKTLCTQKLPMPKATFGG